MNICSSLYSATPVAFLLEKAGATVQTAAFAEKALAALTRFKPDVLLSDVGIPEMNGYMLMQQIRSLPAAQGGGIPAIALTAYAGEYNQQQSLTAGFQQHLSKPVEPETLVSEIATLASRA